MTSIHPPLGALKVVGDRLIDETGAEIILRGVNMGGDCKLPYPDGGTHHPTDFADHREVSFIGRPFPLSDADEHFSRLRSAGFNCLRLLTTWEAISHAGPGQYDTEYLTYFEEICRLAGEYGFYVFVDFHQDVWSRMSGGSGAPGWTWEAVGLDFTKFYAADAALTMQAGMDWSDPNPYQDGYPQMVWSSNYGMPANSIMWSLFWMGAAVTPDFLIDGENVQHFLQRHYFEAVDQVAQRVAKLPHVIGFDSLNEPGKGWWGMPLSGNDPDTGEPIAPVKPGPVWSPILAMAAARGMSVDLPVFARDQDGMTVTQSTKGNANGVAIWREGHSCPFEQVGLYKISEAGEPEIEQELAFCFDRTEGSNAAGRLFAPFFAKMASTIRQYRKDWIVFAEMDPFGFAGGEGFPAEMPDNWVNASHWYDISILYRKTADPETSFDFLAGKPDGDADGVKRRYARELASIFGQKGSRRSPGLVGEFGIPYDLDKGAAYALWSKGERGEAVWNKHEAALSNMYDTIDALLLHSTQWNYTASNSNSPWVGDGWNQEDLSIFSNDQREANSSDQSGLRAVSGFSRPFIRRAQGEIVSMSYDKNKRSFCGCIDANTSVDCATEIFLPESAQKISFGLSDLIVKNWTIKNIADYFVLEVYAEKNGLIDVTIKI